MALLLFHRAALLLAVLLVTATAGQAALPVPLVSRADAWAHIQQARLGRLGPMVQGLLHNPSNQGSPTHGSHTGVLREKAHEWLLLTSLPEGAGVAEVPSLQATQAFLGLHPAHAGARLQQAQPVRQLLQLSGAVTDLTVANNQVTRSTNRTSSLKDPEGTFQFASNEFSSSMVPFDEYAAKSLAEFSPGLAAASDALSKASAGSEGSATGSAAASGGSSPASSDVQAATAAALPVVAMAGGVVQRQAPEPTLRIVGGVEAPTDRKHVCALRIATEKSSSFLYCGCTLIAPNVVLTAAHCVAESNLRTPTVEIGRYYQNQAKNNGVNDFDRIQCIASVHHPAWSGTTAQGDIGLCFLQSPSRFQPVTLADQATTKVTAGQPLTVLGWGATSEGGSNAASLMTVDVSATDLATCNQAYQNTINGDTQLCAGVPGGGKDACQGDSGGPLIIRGNTAADDVQVGIVSFGIGCARPNMPGVYTDVRAYRQWIAQQMLARGISYAPVTGGFSATAARVDQATGCACTDDGKSGSTLLSAELAGCKQHGLNVGDSEYYCYTRAGTDCTTATPSDAYPGAAWISCNPQVAKSEGAPASQGAAVTSSSQGLLSTSAPAATLLGSWIGQWLAGSVARAGPNITAVLGGAPMASNRTAVVSRRSAGLLDSRAAARPDVVG